MDDFGVVTEPRTVRLERMLPASLERVWSYLVDSEKRGVWLAAGAIEPRVGGRVELNFMHADLSEEKVPPPAYAKLAGGHRMEGRVTRWQPPHVLAYTWGGVDADSEVTFELSARGDQTLLVVTHRRLKDRAELVNVAGGWDAHVGLLLDHLRGDRPRGFWSTHARLKAEYEARIPGA